MIVTETKQRGQRRASEIVAQSGNVQRGLFDGLQSKRRPDIAHAETRSRGAAPADLRAKRDDGVAPP
jgi:hypothetical protein